MQFEIFGFSPFQENTYVLYDDSKQCIVVDPGNFFPQENEKLDQFFKEHSLDFVEIFATHCHLDHLFGAKYLCEKYGVEISSHKEDLFWVDNFRKTADGYGLEMAQQPPKPTRFIDESTGYHFGNTSFDIIHVPGHSPGSVALYQKEEGVLFCGDILFSGSVGRSDFPKGDHDLLISGIKEKLLGLPEETRVYSGHGPMTTIGHEKLNNPFLR